MTAQPSDAPCVLTRPKESMFECVASVRDRWLKPGGIMLPARAQMYVAPIAEEKLWLSFPHFFSKDLYGLDFRFAAYASRAYSARTAHTLSACA